MKKSLKRTLCISILLCFIFPLIHETIMTIQFFNYLEKTYPEEGYYIENIQIQKGMPWVIYKSKTDDTYKIGNPSIKWKYLNYVLPETSQGPSASEDGYTRSDVPGTVYNVNSLNVYYNKTGGTKWHVYVKTDFPDGAGTISSVILKMYCTSSFHTNSPEFYIDTTVNAWSETTLTWNNAPSVGARVCTYNEAQIIARQCSSSAYHDWELESGAGVTNPICSNLLYSWGDTLSVRFSFYIGSAASEYWYWSSSETVDPPYLLITYTPPPPDTPSITAPTGGATNVSAEATITSSAFSGNDVGDTHAASQWQVDDDADFSSPVWDSGTDTTNLISTITDPSHGTFANELAGEETLAINTTYNVKVKHKSSNGQWSDWSTAVQFTTATQPDQPTNVSPSNGAEDVSRNPTLEGSAFSNGGNSQEAAQWQVDDDADFSSPVWDSGTDTTNLTSTTVNTTNGTFGNELAGETELAACSTYYFREKYESEKCLWSDWSTGTSFQTTDCNVAPNTPSITSPTSGQTGVILNPEITSSDFDDNDVGDIHEASRWQIDTDSNFGSPDWDSGTDTTNLTSTTVNELNGTFGNELAGEIILSDYTSYYVRVSFYDGDDWSSYSTGVLFITNQKPNTPSITKPEPSEIIATTYIFEFSAFVDDDDDTHAATELMIRLIDGTYDSPEYDSGWDTTNLETMTVSGLTDHVQCYGRVRYKDDKGLISAWSAEVFFQVGITGGGGVGGGGGGGTEPVQPVVPVEAEQYQEEEIIIKPPIIPVISERPVLREETDVCTIPDIHDGIIAWLIAVLKCFITWLYLVLKYICAWFIYIISMIVSSQIWQSYVSLLKRLITPIAPDFPVEIISYLIPLVIIGVALLYWDSQR